VTHLTCPRCFLPLQGTPTCIGCGAPSPEPAVKPEPKAIPDPPPQYVEPAGENNPRGKDLRESAERWIRDNPEAFALFERFALEALQHGRPFGAKLLAERVRWESTIVLGRDEDGYKISNNHTAYIARALADRHPELLRLMRFRQTRY